MDLPQEKKNICDICGDIGVDSAILTCTQCKINSEHMYCMKVVLEEAIEDWICDACANPEPEASMDPVEVGKSGALPAEKSKLQNESRVGSGSGNWEKRVEKGKTKFLPVLEAIKLSSGDKNSSASVRSNWRSHSKGPKCGMDATERSAIRSKTVPMSFSSQQDLASGSSQSPKLNRTGNMEISKKPVQHSTKLTDVPRPVSSPQRSKPSSKYLDIQKELQKETQWAQTKVRRPVKKLLSTPSLDAPPVSISGGNIHSSKELRISDGDNTNAVVWPEFEKHSQIPALDAVWKGIFRIHDYHRQEELNPQIQAHPPSRVLKKIYEFSQKMPEELHFQLVCAKTLLDNLFNEETPDERDVGLYFFPSVGIRSKDYICLLESINLRDLALRLQIGDVELLVFTSKLLPANYRRWDGQYFLWGVFHHVKNDITACYVERALDQSMIPSDEAIHDQEEVDMEIDMIGGTEVGRIDVRVAKQPPVRTSTCTNGESAAYPALPGPNQPRSGVSKPVLAKVKTEVQEIPPGFEEEYRRRLQGS